MAVTDSSSTFFSKRRIFVIAGVVLVFHALAIWALQSGLLMRAVELVVPVEVLAQIIEPPKPATPPPPVIPKETPPPKPEVVKQTPKPPVPQTQAPPPILAVETATPAPNAPAPVQIAPPAPLLPPSVPVAAVATPAPAPVAAAPAKVEQVTVDGNYLNFLKPKKSNLSIRMGEHGNAKIKVYVGIDGLPKRAEVLESSGFPRLDQLAKDAVMMAKYRPKRVNGNPVDAEFEIPFIFERD